MSYTPLVNTILAGDARAVTASTGDNDTSIATTAFVQGELGDYLPLAGGTMTGDITLAAGVDINFDNTNSGLQWSDVRISRAAANVIQLDSGDQLRVQQDPLNDNDVARKAYVDNLIDGLYWKDPVDLATTSAITLSGEQTIDGVATSSSRVLVKDQGSAAANGIYRSAAGAWTREADADSGTELNDGATVWVRSGTTNGDSRFTQTAAVTTIGTDAQTWVQTGSATTIDELNELTDVDTTGVLDGAFLRYEATGSTWFDTTNFFLNDNGQLQVTATGASAGLLLGGDAQLYRSAADVLRTPDSLVVDGTSTLTGLVSAPAGILIDDDKVSFDNMVSGTATVIETDVAGDTQKRLIVDAAGRMLWGSGSAVGDTNLYRAAANALKTDDALEIVGKLTSGAGQRVATVVKTANYNVNLATDYIILADNSGDTANLTITLPAGHSAGDIIHVKDTGGTAASGAFGIFIATADADTIDGSASDFELTVNYQSVTLVSDGVNWNII